MGLLQAEAVMHIQCTHTIHHSVISDCSWTANAGSKLVAVLKDRGTVGHVTHLVASSGLIEEAVSKQQLAELAAADPLKAK